MSMENGAQAVAQTVEVENGAQAEVRARLWLRQLRDGNLKAHEGGRPDVAHFRSLNSTIAKCSAFAKKCAKLSAETSDSLVKELRTLNLNKYVSEVAGSVASAALKPTDLEAAVIVCSELHQLYAEFSHELLQALSRLISPSPKTDLAQRRVALRLFTELFIAGVLTDQVALTSIVKEITDAKDPKQLPLTLQLALSFVRSGGRDILGLIPSSIEAKISQYKDAGLLRWTDKLDASLQHIPYEPVLDNVVSSDRRAAFVALITALYQKMSTIFLQSHKRLREMEQKNQDLLVTRHEIPAEASAAYTKQLEQFENFQKTLISLADMLHLDVPNLPQQDKVTRLKEAKPSSSSNNNNTDADDNEDSGPWESEEAKKFYEMLPDLKVFLPASLLALDTTKPSGATSSPSSSNASTQTSLPTETVDASSPPASRPDGSQPTSASSPQTTPDAATSSNDPSKPSAAQENTPDALTNFFEKLMRCSNRQLIDDAAMEFVRFNQKSWRSKLAVLMHSAPRNRLDALRYFSRFVAILHPYFKDIGLSIVKRLEEEFLFLFKQKDQTNSPSKLWNARFLGELTKFKICPPNTVLTFLKRCLDDFIGYNVHVACELVETCGRYLLNLPETRVRTTNLLDQMASLKTSKHFHVTLEIQIDNALQAARPIERIVKVVAPLPPIQQYIQKLLFLDLKKDTLAFVVTQLKKVPWAEQEAFLLKAMLKVYKNKYQHIALVASLVAQLSQVHLQFGVKFLDHLLELVRVDLEERKFSNHQKLVMNVTLLGELINHKLADAKLFYKVLYSIIRYNTITFPKSGPSDFTFKPLAGNEQGASNAGVGGNMGANTPSLKEQQRDHALSVHMAWIEDSFRIRLVCTLLNTCRSLSSFAAFHDTQTGRTMARDLDSFLVYFQRFLFMQRHITPELHSLLDDTWYIVRPPYLFRTPEELETKIAALRTARPSFEGIDERLSLPYLITSTNAQEAIADDEDDDTRLDDLEQNDAASFELSSGTGGDDSTPKGEDNSSAKASAVPDANKQHEDELAKMFDSMLMDSMGIRTNVNTRANNSIFSVPLVALKRKAEVIKQTTKDDLVIPAIERHPTEAPSGHLGDSKPTSMGFGSKSPNATQSTDDDGTDDRDDFEEDEEDYEGEIDEEEDEFDDEDEEDSEYEDEEDEEDDLELDDDSSAVRDSNSPPTRQALVTTATRTERPTPSMTFQFLARKPGNKPVIGSIDLPADSAMVKRHLHSQEVAQQQKEAMQAVTMKLHRMGEEAEAKREDGGQTIQYTPKTPSKPVRSTTYAAAVEALSTSVPKKAYTPQSDSPAAPRSPARGGPKK